MMDVRDVDIPPTVSIDVRNRGVHPFVGIPPDRSEHPTLHALEILPTFVEVEIIRAERHVPMGFRQTPGVAVLPGEMTVGILDEQHRDLRVGKRSTDLLASAKRRIGYWKYLGMWPRKSLKRISAQQASSVPRR